MKKFIALLLLCASCSSGSLVVPDDVLPREKFKTVLLEAQLIEARMNHELVVAHHSSIPGELYYAEMFKEQGITKAEFERSFRFYAEHPEDMKKIYEELFAELSRRKDEEAQ